MLGEKNNKSELAYFLTIKIHSVYVLGFMLPFLLINTAHWCLAGICKGFATFVCTRHAEGKDSNRTRLQNL